MLIVGELINSSCKAIAEAITRRDSEYLKELARKQVEAGAHVIDVNCGTSLKEEVSIMEWLVDTVQEAVKVPLCLCSLRPKLWRPG